MRVRLKRPSKRLTIVLFGVVLVAVAGLYVWQSVQAWQAYEKRLTNEEKSYQQLKDRALSDDSAEARLSAIRQLDDKVSVRDQLCDINGLYAWQTAIIPPLSSGVERCTTAVKKLSVVSGPLHSLREYLDTGEQLQAMVKKLAPGGTLNEKNWSQMGLAKAKQLKKDLEALKTASSEAKALRASALALTDMLISNWEALIAASAAKDKSTYIAASAGVVKAYADFTGLADVSDTVIAQKVGAVMAAYDT